jgi:glucose-6-phosphate 1-dehydrogenase
MITSSGSPPLERRIMQPLLDAPPPVHAYAPGTWGPKEADRLLEGHGRWLGPWIGD